jgi:ATP-binding cassette subfamily F protein 3
MAGRVRLAGRLPCPGKGWLLRQWQAAVLTVSQIEKHFGARTVLAGVNFVLKPGQRVALVGRNGSGKSTLMKILCGQLEADRGTVSLVDGMRLGYLEQEGQVQAELTLAAEMRTCFADLDQLEAEVRALEERLAHDESCLSRYDRLQNRLLHAQPELVEARIGTVLDGLGFTAADRDKLCHTFSGGWQMRIALAKLLLNLPDVLLLDEPTNHLDIEAVEWLEGFLAEFSGAVLLVSHDRHFLDKVCNRTLELSQGELEIFAGNYTYYEEESARRYEQQAAAYRLQQKKLDAEMKFVERFRYKATLATRVQSRLKLIEKRERVDMPERDEASIRLSFVSSLDSGREVLTAKGICKSYQGQPALLPTQLKIERGQRIAFLGPNGSGKSTLMRLICGVEAPDEGRVTPGYRLSLVYFAQHQAEALNLENSILEEVQLAAPAGTTPGQLRNLLGGLLFEGDTVYKKIGVLSGGERGRVALARCLATPSNVLALDEPTNHLDLDARENLLEALMDYPGTLMFISHDRYFLERLATQVWELKAGRLRVFDGSYAHYRETLLREQRAAEQVALEKERAKQAEQRQKSQQYRDNARQARSQKGHHWTLEALEKKIFALEAEMQGISEQLGEPGTYQQPDLAQKLQQSFDQLQAQCQELTSIWEEMAS